MNKISKRHSDVLAMAISGCAHPKAQIKLLRSCPGKYRVRKSAASMGGRFDFAARL